MYYVGMQNSATPPEGCIRKNWFILALVSGNVLFASFWASIGNAKYAEMQTDWRLEATYPDSEEGFQSQFKEMVKGYCSEGKDHEVQLPQQFALPNASEWFSENFEPGDAAPLAERYTAVDELY
jgi:hypothetical protein